MPLSLGFVMGCFAFVMALVAIGVAIAFTMRAAKSAKKKNGESQDYG